MQWVCCRERHRHNGQHYHMAIKLEHIRKTILLKDKHGITVNFSIPHDNYYSAWKYVTKQDEEVLQSADHPQLWNSKLPRTRRASEARAGHGRLRYSQHQTEQSEHGSSKQKKRKRMSAFELSQIIVENEITTLTEVLAFADEQSGEGKTDIAEFVVNRGSRVVAEVLQTAWEINSAKENLECSR